MSLNKIIPIIELVQLIKQIFIELFFKKYMEIRIPDANKSI